MKVLPGIVLMVSLVLAVPCVVQAKGKGKGKGKEEEQPATPAPEAEPNLANPVSALSPYIVNLDQLLALNRPGNVANQPLFTQASGRLITLRQGLVVEAGNAVPEKKNQFVAAVNTCDLLSAALTEREKVAADLASSKSVTGSGAIDQQARKDNLAQGMKAHGIAKAVGIIEERDREKQAAANAKHQAANGDNAITAMSVNNWNQRSIEWHQKIAASFSQIR